MIYLVCQVNIFNFENAVIWREVKKRTKEAGKG